jgi:hypothetical protein
MAEQKNPGLLSSAASSMRQRTAILRACYGGTQTMRAMEKEFLPQYEKESNTRYEARLNSTFAVNKLREAVDAASAKPFRTMIGVQNTDPDLDMWIEDIDLQGNHLHLFAHQLFNNGMLDGQCHILADHPDTYDLPNLQAQKAAGIRPYLKLIKDNDLIAAYSEYVGGDTQVTHVQGSPDQPNLRHRKGAGQDFWGYRRRPALGAECGPRLGWPVEPDLREAHHPS